MRFELFLTELPKASAAKVQSALGELPKGASSGTILKAMEAKTVPTVSVAWSDDKRVLNEVMDTLVDDLGAGCKLVDHGSLLQKLITFVGEKAGRARYLDDEDDKESRSYIKIGGHQKHESMGAALTRHAVTYFLQLCLTGVLFIWFVALRVGMENTFTADGLVFELAACALGLLVAYVSTTSVRSVQAGRRELKTIAPQLGVAIALTVCSVFFLGPGAKEKAEGGAGTVKRPPSLPYSGLLTELRRRKLAQEASGRDEQGSADEDAVAGAEQGEQGEEELWCERPEPASSLECSAGRAWEEALACLNKPELPKQPRRIKTVRAPVAAAEPPSALPPSDPVAPPAAPVVEQRWGVTLELSTVLVLAAMWCLSLLGLVLFQRERAKARATKPVESAASALPVAPVAPAPPAAPAVQDDAALLAARVELEALRTELVLAQAELSKSRVEAEAEFVPPSPQLATLQRDLELARGALGAHQAALSQQKQLLAQMTSEHEAMQQALRETLAQRDQARSALQELGGRAPDNDTGGRNTGLTRGLPSVSAEDSSYSVSEVQEERVLQKRRR